MNDYKDFKAGPSNSDLMLCLVGVVALILVFAFVGEQDYQDQSAVYCEKVGGDWDGKICLKDPCRGKK